MSSECCYKAWLALVLGHRGTIETMLAAGPWSEMPIEKSRVVHMHPALIKLRFYDVLFVKQYLRFTETVLRGLLVKQFSKTDGHRSRTIMFLRPSQFHPSDDSIFFFRIGFQSPIPQLN